MDVLVCDDDPAARQVAKRWLTTALGCTVVECEDGVQALELLSARPFDLALVDLDLPRLTGVEVVEAIRASELTRDLPVVILSQERREAVVRALVALGISSYLLKPLRERVAVERIGPLLASRRAARVASGESPVVPQLNATCGAMLVDGDPGFRTDFGAVAGRYGAVVAAESGADALALFRRAPVALVFVGESLGIIGAEVLARKVREVGSGRVMIVGLGVATDQVGPGKAFDAVIPRVADRETLEQALQPYVGEPLPPPDAVAEVSGADGAAGAVPVGAATGAF